MLVPTLEGWKVETIGDDIAWMKFGDDGRLYAVNPEAGFFGVAPGTASKTNPNAMDTIERNTIFTNCAQDRRRRRLVGGHDREPPAHADRLEGQRLDARLRRARRAPERPLHDARRRSARRSPTSGRTPQGVPIDAFLFGGRRSTVVPLVREAFDWEHGVFLGATMSSEKTAAAAGTVGELRFDPFAMLPFCGYNMADYFAHWLKVGRARRREAAEDLPRQLVPQGRRRQVPLARASARTRACWPGSSAAATARRETGRDPDRPTCRRPAQLDIDGLDLSDAACRRC